MSIRDSQGRIYVDTDGVPVSWNAGLGFTADMRLCITETESPTDTFINGLRVDAVGRVVVSDGILAARPYFFNRGLPTDKRSTTSGDLIRQNNQTPVASDPYVAGLRVGPLGGVYVLDLAPPIGDAPVNTVPPDTTGDARIGSTLTTTTGTWTGTATITYTYQWYSGINIIVGATNSTYVVQASDLGNAVICQVTATNTYGGGVAYGPGVRIVTARYNYVNNGGIPASGWVSAGSVSAPLQVRISEVDKDGIDHNGPLSRLRQGDSVFVGTQEGILSAEPIDAGGYYIFEMVSWPLLTDGPYDVTFGFNQ